MAIKGKHLPPDEERILRAAMSNAQKLLDCMSSDFDALAPEQRKERITDTMLALGYAQAVMAYAFLDIEPEEFGEQIRGFLISALEQLKQLDPEGSLRFAKPGSISLSHWD
jgi:hypothetical protein